jgi:four helix bundle protein
MTDEYKPSASEPPMVQETTERMYDLQQRLIVYAVSIIHIIEQLPTTPTGRHISSQLLRSGTSVAANYGEAQSAESSADFIHKMKISLKELRETEIWLRIIVQGNLHPTQEQLTAIIKETNELIAIFFTSINTAKRNQER